MSFINTSFSLSGLPTFQAHAPLRLTILDHVLGLVTLSGSTLLPLWTCNSFFIRRTYNLISHIFIGDYSPILATLLPRSLPRSILFLRDTSQTVIPVTVDYTSLNIIMLYLYIPKGLCFHLLPKPTCCLVLIIIASLPLYDHTLFHYGPSNPLWYIIHGSGRAPAASVSSALYPIILRSIETVTPRMPHARFYLFHAFYMKYFAYVNDRRAHIFPQMHSSLICLT